MHSRKADQSVKPGNGSVNGQCMSVAISRANEMEQAQCDKLVSSPKSCYIYVVRHSLYPLSTFDYMHKYLYLCPLATYCNKVIHINLQPHLASVNQLMLCTLIISIKRVYKHIQYQFHVKSMCLIFNQLILVDQEYPHSNIEINKNTFDIEQVDILYPKSRCCKYYTMSFIFSLVLHY